jgi:benzoate 4-monooxygenase
MQFLPFDPFWRQKSALSLQNLAAEAFQERKHAKVNDRKDMLSYLLTAKSEDGDALTEESVIAEAASFISGGSDSTSTTLTHFVDLVSRNVEVRKKLQAELDQAFPLCQMKNDWVPSDEVARSLPYLQATLREVLRIRPTSASGLERIIIGQPLEIAGYKIPPHVRIYAPILHTASPVSNESQRR